MVDGEITWVFPTVDLYMSSLVSAEISLLCIWLRVFSEDPKLMAAVSIALFLSLLVGSVLAISDELAAEFGYPAGVDVWSVI
jgi:hypothetical protein